MQQTRVRGCKLRGFSPSRWMNGRCPIFLPLAAADEAAFTPSLGGARLLQPRAQPAPIAAVRSCLAKNTGANCLLITTGRLLCPASAKYTAGAVASIAFGLPVPAVDGNVLRVAARLDNDFTPITDAKFKKQTRERFAALMPSDRPGDLNQSLMELSETVCLPNGAPRCDDCPIQHLCEGFHRGTRLVMPPRSRKRRGEWKTAPCLLCAAVSLSVCGRDPKGLLAGLWSAVARWPSRRTSCAALTEMGGAMQSCSLRPAKHIFTHVEWHMNGGMSNWTHLHPLSPLSHLPSYARRFTRCRARSAALFPYWRTDPCNCKPSFTPFRRCTTAKSRDASCSARL